MPGTHLNGTPNEMHGHTTGRKFSPEYRAWRCMIERCSPRFKGRGGHIYRNMHICERWRDSFLAFLEDMGPRPPGTTLDRIDGPKGYQPGNCKWSTPKEQSRNTRTNVLVTYNGRTQCLQAWADEVGVSKHTLRWRLRHWSLEKSMTHPLRDH